MEYEEQLRELKQQFGEIYFYHHPLSNYVIVETTINNKKVGLANIDKYNGKLILSDVALNIINREERIANLTEQGKSSKLGKTRYNAPVRKNKRWTMPTKKYMMMKKYANAIADEYRLE